MSAPVAANTLREFGNQLFGRKGGIVVVRIGIIIRPFGFAGGAQARTSPNSPSASSCLARPTLAWAGPAGIVMLGLHFGVRE